MKVTPSQLPASVAAIVLTGVHWFLLFSLLPYLPLLITGLLYLESLVTGGIVLRPERGKQTQWMDTTVQAIANTAALAAAMLLLTYGLNTMAWIVPIAIHAVAVILVFEGRRDKYQQ